MSKPKILLLDIETKPTLAYVWRLYKENVGIEQIEDAGGMICFGAKWFGDREKLFYSDWEHGHEEVVRQAHALISEADAVVTYNGDSFDLTKLRGEFLLANLSPPPPVTSIDVYKTVKKLGFVSGKLGFIGPLLGLGKKVKHEGFGLWKDVMKGNCSAQGKMKSYCLQDVVLLEKVYKKIRPYITNHPHLGFSPPTACGSCGSVHTQKRGFRRTKSFVIQRIQCQSCGAWSDGTRKKVGDANRNAG